MPFWKPKKKKKAAHKAKSAKSLPKYEPKPFIPPEIPKIDISANQQKESQKPAPKKASSPRADDKKYFIETFNKLVSERNRPWDIWKDFVLMTACAFSNAVDKTHYDEREDRYLKAIAKYRKEEQALFPELLAEMTVALEATNLSKYLLHTMFAISWRLRRWVMLLNRSKKAALSQFTMIAAEAVRL